MLKKTLVIIAGLIVIGVLYVDVSSDKFRDKVKRDVRQISDRAAAAPARKFSSSQLVGLPEPVQRYFKHVLRDGQEYIRTAKLKQTGEFKTKEADRWVPLDAEQYYAIESPSFVWHARLKPTPYTWIEARDMYHNGRGFMEVKLLSAFPLIVDSGKEIELSSLARFLVEAPWYPTALLPGKNIEWKAVDSNSAIAMINDAGYSVSALFAFADNGEIKSVSTEDRYRNINGKKDRIAWTAHYTNYQELNGVKVPSEVVATWNLQKGDFQYARLKMTKVLYNEF